MRKEPKGGFFSFSIAHFCRDCYNIKIYQYAVKGAFVMNHNKLSRLLEPNLKLYFFCMVVFSLVAIPISVPLALVEGIATAGLYLYFSRGN